MSQADQLIEWFSQNTMIVSVDTAIQAKDRLNIGERNRLKERAAFILAQRLIDAGVVATTIIREPRGDVLRLQVQTVRPEVWCPTHKAVFDVLEVPRDETLTAGPGERGEHAPG